MLDFVLPAQAILTSSLLWFRMGELVGKQYFTGQMCLAKESFLQESLPVAHFSP